MSTLVFPLSELSRRGLAPPELTTWLGARAPGLDGLGFTDLTVAAEASATTAGVELVVPIMLRLEPFGPSSFALILPRRVLATARLAQNRWEYEISAGVRLRVPPEMLRPVTPGDEFVELEFRPRLRLLQSSGQSPELRLDVPAGLTLPPAMIGNSGFVIAAEGVQLSLIVGQAIPEVIAAGFDASFQGIYIERAELRLPDWLPLSLPNVIKIDQCAVGTGGFSGKVRVQWNPQWNVGARRFRGDGSGTVFGTPIAIREFVFEVRANQFAATYLAGDILLPFLDAPTQLSAQLSVAGESLLVQLNHPAAISVPAPGATFRAGSLAATGEVSSASGLSLAGQFTQVSLRFGTLLTLDAATATFHITAKEAAFTLRAEVGRCNFGPLGMLDSAELRVEDDGQGNRAASVRARMQWADLAARLQAPPNLPVPRPGSTVQVEAGWTVDANGAQVLVLRCAAESASLDEGVLALIPERVRPQFRNLQLVFEARYSSEHDFASASTQGTLTGSFSAALETKLAPWPFADNGLIDIQSGGADGWMLAQFFAGVFYAGQPALSLSLQEPVSFRLRMPGMPRSEPLLRTDVTRIAFDLAGGQEVDAALTLAGTFGLQPPQLDQTVPLASHLTALLESLPFGDLTGTVSGALRFRGARAHLELDAEFSNAQVDIGVFALLARLAAPGPPAPAAPLDLEVGFGLRGVSVQLGSLDPQAPSDAENAALAILTDFRFGDLQAHTSLRISDRKLSIGLDSMDVPLRMPPFPLRAAALPAPNDAAWTQRLATLDHEINSRPPDDRRRGQLAVERALLREVQAVRTRISGAQERVNFQNAVATFLGVIEAVTGVFAPDTDLKLALRDVRFELPFSDPRDISVRGGAGLTGFAADDPLKPLENLQLGLGISADQIFFFLEGLGDPIPIPDFGRYPGGTVSLSRLTIGYGYTRNSFAMSFQGELHLPPQLIADADTSRVLGIGVRAPEQSRLGFRLDLIPVPGPIPVVPLFELDADLRKAGSPALVAAGRCEPFWDGLQLHIPGVIETDIKQLTFSPLFSILPVPNARFDGDLVLGDDHNGLSIVADNCLFLFGVLSGSGPVPIPLIAEPQSPYFENLCIDLHLAGFRLHLHLERPFPSIPLTAILELLGLLADPTLAIDPDGPLANIVRVAMRDAQLTVPRPLRRLFPEIADRLAVPTTVVLNFGTFLTALQAAGEAVKAAIDGVERGAGDLQSRLRRLQANPPNFGLGAALATLPPAVRRIEAGCNFGGFEAAAVLLLLDARDSAALRHQFELRDGAQPPPTSSGLAWGRPTNANALARFEPRYSRPPRARAPHPDSPQASLVTGPAFADFTTQDIAALPSHPRAANAPAGVVLGARVKVFGAQRFRFVGYLFEDGVFGLVTAVDVPPLRLSVAGVPVELPLQAKGRLTLAGRCERDGVTAHVAAQGYARWDVIPGVLRVEAGSEQKPVRLEIGERRFLLEGGGGLVLFDGAARLDGAVSISETHCFVRGHLEWRAGGTQAVPLIAIEADLSGRVGPGPHFSVAGAGGLRVLGHDFTGVRATVSDTGASLSASLDTQHWTIAGRRVPCRLRMSVTGAIDLARRETPSFQLDGTGNLEFAGLEIEGRAGLCARNGSFRTYLEGGLRWQGRRWLNGSVVVSDSGLRLHGRTDFAVNLTPSNLLGITLASLYLKVDLEGRVDLDADADLGSFSLEGNWTLGARAASNQVFPLAMQRLAASGQTQLAVELVHIRGFRLVPLRDFGEIELPIPVFQPSSPPDPIEFGTGPVPLIGTQPGLRWGGMTLGGDLSQGQVVGEIPLAFKKVSDTTTISLPFDLGDDFAVALVWRQKRLQIRVTRQGEPSYHNL